MIRSIFLILALLVSYLFAYDFDLTKGWNLVGNGAQEITLEQKSPLQYVFYYEKNKWRVFPNTKQYKSLTTIAPYRGVWMYAKKNGKVSLPAVYKNIDYITLYKGWNCISSNVGLETFHNNENILLLWSYDNGIWYYWTENGKIDTLLQKARYSRISTILPDKGIWVYALQDINIDIPKRINYFSGKKIDKIKTGIEEFGEEVRVVSKNYPVNKYGKFLKNGKEIESNDLIISPTDSLTFVPNIRTSINFIDLDDIKVDYITINSNKSSYFLIVMPKYDRFNIEIDENDVDTNQYFFSKIGRHRIAISLIDKNGLPIKNSMIYMDVDKNYSSRFNALQGYTNDIGEAVFYYTLSKLKNEVVPVTPYFFDAYRAKFEKTILLKNSTIALDLSTNTLNINEPDSNYTIEGTVFDRNTQAPLKNVTLQVSYLPIQYGKMSTYSLTSDSNGHFSFFYSSPRNIRNIEDTKFRIYNDFVSKEIVLHFVSSKNINIEEYKIKVVSDTVQITQPNERKSIELYVYKIVDGMNKPYSGANVKVGFMDEFLGSFDSYSKNTDTSGRIVFTYTAPAKIGYRTIHARFYLADKTNIDKNITISFIPHGISSNTKLEIAPQNINVTASDTQYDVKVNVIDENGMSMEGIEIALLGELVEDGVDYGNFDKRKAITDANGIATFVYTSPKDAQLLYGLKKQVKFQIKDTNISQILTINYEEPRNIPNVSKIVIEPVKIRVSKGTKTELNIFTYDKSDRLISSIVWVEGLVENNISLGKISPTRFRTDENGKAVVLYQAPKNLDVLKGKTKTIVFKTENGIESRLILEFSGGEEGTSKLVYDKKLINSQINLVHYEKEFPNTVYVGNVEYPYFSNTNFNETKMKVGDWLLVKGEGLAFKVTNVNKIDINTILIDPNINKSRLKNGNYDIVTTLGECVITNKNMIQNQVQFAYYCTNEENLSKIFVVEYNTTEAVYRSLDNLTQ